MKDIKLTDDGDIDINASNGNVEMVSGDDDLSQQLGISLNINMGELSWNRDLGIDFNALIANGNREDVINSILSDYLSTRFNDTFQSINVTHYAINASQRTLTFNADINLNNGETISIGDD